MNKKLIKILACSACGLGIATSIPFMATSCGSTSNPYAPDPKDPDQILNRKDLPIDVLYIEDGKLYGFKSDFLKNSEQYNNYNTLFIPKSVKNVLDYAFVIRSSEGIETSIPSYIWNLVFEDGENNLSVGAYAFAYGQFKRFVCSRIQSISNYAFMDCNKCKSIKFKGDTSWFSAIKPQSALQEFSGWNNDGTIYCQDPTPDPENPYGAELAKEVLIFFDSTSFNYWTTIDWESSK